MLADNQPSPGCRAVAGAGQWWWAIAYVVIEVIEHPDPDVERQVHSYLAGAPAEQTCHQHDPRWLHVLREALGHRTYMLVARGKEDGICGYLPLALVAGRLFGRFLVSLPYVDRGGVVADSSPIAAALIDAAVRLADDLDVRYLELRHRDPVPHPDLPQCRDEKHQMVLGLPADADGLWQAVGTKVRNQVRKGDTHDLTIRWGRCELVDAFYTVFAVNMRDLGTPVFPRKLFVGIVERFEANAELSVVFHQKQPVAAAILVHDTSVRVGVSSDARSRPDPCGKAPGGDQGVTLVPSASSLRRYSATNANMWMYHQLLLRAIERGSGEFDFGRSSEGSGTYRFKKQWGAMPRPSVWQYHVRRGDINAMRPDSPRNRRRIAAWQKLPVWMTRMIGPAIVRKIP